MLQAIGRELDFRVEAGNTRKLQGILGRSKFVPQGSLKVPNVVPALSSQQVLVLEWIDGHNIRERARSALTQHGSSVDDATRRCWGRLWSSTSWKASFTLTPTPATSRWMTMASSPCSMMRDGGDV